MRGSDRESGTFISDHILKKFKDLSVSPELASGVSLQLTEIIGKRWAYRAGPVFGDFPSFPPERIQISETIGIVLYPRRELSAGEKEKIRDIIEAALNEGYGQGNEDRIG